MFERRETAHLPWNVRDRLETEAAKAMARHPARLAVWILVMLLMIASLIVGVFSLGNGPLGWLMTWLQIPTVAGMIAAMWIEFRLRRRAVIRLMLAEGGRTATCFDCGYDLRGTTGDTCPECGCRIAAAPKAEG
ncbi:MAG: hypothetical protein WDZ31_14535 [Phycisphaeraceae bacterium]